MTRIPAQPDETPEQAATRITQNAANVFAPAAERFASVLERHAGNMPDEARAAVHKWTRDWCDRLVEAAQAPRPDVGLNLLDGIAGETPAPSPTNQSAQL